MTVQAGAPRTQLWKEEPEVLARLAARVPDGGTILEIGTAEGGTALLMRQATGGREVAITSVDIAPSPLARGYLEGSGVQLVERAAGVYAEEWARSVRRPIDLLFIDGNHDLEHVVGDWNSWTPWVRPGGCVVLHDHDPAARGGLVHLAVRVAVETILRRGLLLEPRHEYRLLHGIVEDPSRTSLTAAECQETLARIAARIAGLQSADQSESRLLADERTVTLLRGCLRAEQGLTAISPAEAKDPARRYLVCLQPDGARLAALRERGIPEQSLEPLDSLTLCHLLARGLRTDHAYFADRTTAQHELLFWAEAARMIDYGFGESPFPDRISALAELDLGQLSRLVAREQVRATVLARILRTLVDWVP